jgi:hypothetical protein
VQLVSQDIYLGPLKDDKDKKFLVNPDDVPDTESELKHYMLTPFISQTRVFSTKIIIHSNVDLKAIKTNPDFLQYIGEEGIKIDYNRLDTVLPSHVGILEQVSPRHDTLLFHYDRLSKLLPASAPLFQICIQKTFGKDSKWVMIVMIQSEKEDVPVLSQLLIDLAKTDKIKFFRGMHMYV